MSTANGIKEVVAEVVAKEIVGLRREQKILASKVEAAIGRLDDAIARAEVRSSDNTLRGRTLTR